MDTQDYQVTVQETWEGIERAIDELALDGVESYPTEHGLRLMFDDGSYIALAASESEEQIGLQMGEIKLTFYYDEVEEHWYSNQNELRLLTVLSALIGGKLESTITLPDLT